MNNLYKKADVELPYNVETRKYKWIQEGTTKEKIEQKWVVLTTNVNTFIAELPNSADNLALQQPSIEHRGPLSIVTATYGDSELNENYIGDGEICWWTLASGVYTYHVKKWVTNTPEAIKAWAEYCMSGYGYQPHEVSLACNPVAGEPRVMTEATFTPDVETNEANDPTTDEPEEGEEEAEIKEEAQAVNCSSTIDVVGNCKEWYAKARWNARAAHILKVVQAVEEGRVIYRRSGDFGGRVKSNGWYSTDDTNPNALDTPRYTDTEDSVAAWKAALETLPDILVPSLRVSITNKMTCTQKITPQAMQAKMMKAGTREDSISSGGFSMSAPSANLVVEDTQGYKYTIEHSQWFYEGCSYDVTATKARKSYKTGKTFYEGTCTDSYRTTYKFLNDTTWD